MKDFFISYTSHDSSWAEWIAWQLEEEGYSVVIQAWDFDGNWVIGMDKAMKETNRTIAVLSRKYVEALYTQSEWTNSFLKDPTGEKDLLIPVRVDQFEPEGILAQIVYVDLVDKSKEDAKNLLLKRVRGERRKPSSVPSFPNNKNPDKPAAAHRVVTEEPVYPAEKEDTEKLRLARELIVRWRSMYADKIEALQEASILAREWSKGLPRQFDDDMAGVIELAAAVARDFRAIRIHELEFASHYGLKVHETVYGNQALNAAIDEAKTYSPEARASRVKWNEKLIQRGLDPILQMPNKYGFEQIARVLESALALIDFNINKLPRGYLKEDVQEIPRNLIQFRGLFIAGVEYDPKLHLMTGESVVNLIGTFAARNLGLYVLCAQLNRKGSIDLFARDSQYLYYWQDSSQLPTAQYPYSSILDAQFLSVEPGSPVITIDNNGIISVYTVDGAPKVLSQISKNSGIRQAIIWLDPLEDGAWYIIYLSYRFEIASWSYRRNLTEAKREIWDDQRLVVESYYSTLQDLYWWDNGILNLSYLNGLPCLIVVRNLGWCEGVGIHFLDPISLLPIRPPLLVKEFIGGITIVAGRWLYTTLLKSGTEPRNRILVWDLFSDSPDPTGGWFETTGDVYTPIVIAEGKNAFQTLQVFRTLNVYPAENFFELVHFDWPSGKITPLKRYSDLQIWPVYNTIHSG